MNEAKQAMLTDARASLLDAKMAIRRAAAENMSPEKNPLWLEETFYLPIQKMVNELTREIDYLKGLR